jgi:hypothetical protein
VNTEAVCGVKVFRAVDGTDARYVAIAHRIIVRANAIMRVRRIELDDCHDAIPQS